MALKLGAILSKLLAITNKATHFSSVPLEEVSMLTEQRPSGRQSLSRGCGCQAPGDMGASNNHGSDAGIPWVSPPYSKSYRGCIRLCWVLVKGLLL